MVEKLSSVRIMTAASLITSVPVIPIAMPMSALFSAGASLTLLPGMATMWLCPFLLVQRSDFVLEGDAGDHPTSRIVSGACSSLRAPNSAPVITVPSMPSSRAIAAAVTA